jgi:hypothetical protein
MRQAKIVAIAIIAALAGCAKYEAMTPELQTKFMADLQAGRMTLDCGVRCRVAWQAAVNEVQEDAMAQHWQDVTLQVMRVGYGNDLAYYYLGQAAEGLGYQTAALAYFNQALAITNGSEGLMKCAAGEPSGTDTCKGINVPAAAPMQIAQIQAAIAAQQAAAEPPPPPPPVHHRKKKVAAKPAVNSSTGSDFVEPPPPPGSAAPQPESGFVTPPPPASK